MNVQKVNWETKKHKSIDKKDVYKIKTTFLLSFEIYYIEFKNILHQW